MRVGICPVRQQEEQNNRAVEKEEEEKNSRSDGALRTVGGMLFSSPSTEKQD